MQIGTWLTEYISIFCFIHISVYARCTQRHGSQFPIIENVMQHIKIINILKIGSDLFNILFAVAMEIFPNKSIWVCQTNVVISSVTYSFPSTLQFYNTNVMSPNLATKLAPKCWTLSKNAFIITLIPLSRLALKSVKASKFIINFIASRWVLYYRSIHLKSPHLFSDFVLIHCLLFILFYVNQFEAKERT